MYTLSTNTWRVIYPRLNILALFSLTCQNLVEMSLYELPNFAILRSFSKIRPDNLLGIDLTLLGDV
jgi:hypothetical protein